MVEAGKPRFTLRPEYFGGLVYDANANDHILLDKDEFALLESLSRREEYEFDRLTGENERFKSRVLDFERIGFLQNDPSGRVSLVSVRLIKPDIIPQGCLTAPIRVWDTYTLRCNMTCTHCMLSSNIFIREPNRRTIDQSAEIMQKFHDAGSMEWRFTGGEAAVQPDLFDAMQIARDLGMDYSLNTNGWWNDTVAEKILNSGVFEVVISLEGTEEVNDLRRHRNSFRHVVETFGRIKEHNRIHPDKAIRTTIAVTVGRDNMNDISFLGDIAVQYGYNLNFMPLKPSGRARSNLGAQMPTLEEYMLISKSIQQLRERPDVCRAGIKIVFKYKDLFNPNCPDLSGKPTPFNYAECGAITTAITLAPDGTVFTCPFILEFDRTGEFTGPNMLHSTVQEAWLHPNFQRLRNVEKTECIGCTYFMRQCRGYCKASVLGFGGSIEGGNLIGHDEYCYKDLMQRKE